MSKKKKSVRKNNLSNEENKKKKNSAIEDMSYEDAVEYLYNIGVPISPTGEPLGIGWDD